MARKQKVLPEVEEDSADGIPLPTGYATRYKQPGGEAGVVFGVLQVIVCHTESMLR
jgi:hypothetical protein